MAHHPFLKSIRPVNLLSFGPNTEEIELKPLNILIGPNGSGKSNLIEIVGLLSKLPDKDPWSDVIEAGGAREWIWKGSSDGTESPSITITAQLDDYSDLGSLYGTLTGEDGVPFQYSISLWEAGGGFGVEEERLVKPDGPGGGQSIFDLMSSPNIPQSPKTDRSVLSQFGDFSELASQWPGMRALAFDLERITCYRDWSFGKISNFRQLQPVGLDSYRLATDSSNVAQVLKAMRDRGDASKFERLLELLRKFYEPVKDVDSELVGTHLRIMIKEEGLTSRTPAERLSDGTLRWLMLLIILLDPTPPPVICIDEPELGLHPDAIHTLADLLVDASTRTQLIITTHSDALLDAFTDTPDVVCVCEKVEGSTVIQRLDKERLKAWLEDYSLGQLWAKGEIGGNRW